MSDCLHNYELSSTGASGRCRKCGVLGLGEDIIESLQQRLTRAVEATDKMIKKWQKKMPYYSNRAAWVDGYNEGRRVCAAELELTPIINELREGEDG